MSLRPTMSEFKVGHTYLMDFLDKSFEGIVAEERLKQRFGIKWILKSINNTDTGMKYSFCAVGHDFTFVTKTPEMSFTL